jgi:quinolinate synthase
LSLIEHSVSSTTRGGLRMATQSDIAAVDPTKSATAIGEMRLEVTIDPAVAARARRAVERMLAL